MRYHFASLPEYSKDVTILRYADTKKGFVNTCESSDIALRSRDIPTSRCSAYRYSIASWECVIPTTPGTWHAARLLAGGMLDFVLFRGKSRCPCCRQGTAESRLVIGK